MLRVIHWPILKNAINNKDKTNKVLTGGTEIELNSYLREEVPIQSFVQPWSRIYHRSHAPASSRDIENVPDFCLDALR